MLKYKNEDIFQSHNDIMIHQCNCLCNWGAGIVVPMKKNYPGAWAKDLQTGYGDKRKLGDYTHWSGPSIHKDERITIINAYGQYAMGRTKTQTDYDALRSALRKVNGDFQHGTIGMPKIGCGLGGGDWNIVSKIIEEEFKGREVTIYEW